jgi:hypothetical protein
VHTSRMVGGLLLLISVGVAAADTFESLASFETSEVDLVVRPGANDAGLLTDFVPGGMGGVPAATDGERVLRLAYANEDGKVEFGIEWLTKRYDLAGYDRVYMDVFVETSTALPGLMGIWSLEWDPPDVWQPAASVPPTAGVWHTVAFDLAGRTQTDLSAIHALVFEQLPAPGGTIYVDHIRLVRFGAAGPPAEVAALGFADRNEVTWSAVPAEALTGYHVYGADAAAGPFTRLTAQPVTARHFVEYGPFLAARYYRVAAVADGVESLPSAVAEAAYNGLTDDELLDMIQSSTFWYFWAYAHPNSKLTVEPWDANACAVGGSGMGLMALVVGAERGYRPRAQVAQRVLDALTFLEDTAQRFHGAWPHVVNGYTGAPVAFGTLDDAADLVETSFVAQGLLTVRQYFDGGDAVETEIRSRATRMWEGIEWDWFERYPGSGILYWHWSPNHGWAVNLPIRGYHEAMIVYLLAIASPTHGMPGSSFHDGWVQPGYVNGTSYYGIVQEVGPPLGGPLFFTHYSHLGFDPRYKRDAYTNYFGNSRAISRIHRAYAIENPMGWAGYQRWAWGLTASMAPDGYEAHSPTNDFGTIAPTAALSAMPYTPDESLATLRYYYDTYGAELDSLWGFYDAFNPTQDWFSDQFISIDQGPIIVMVENYRSGLCWRLFMQNPEIRPMMDAIGFVYQPDLDNDGLFDGADGVLLLDMDLLGGPEQVSQGDPEAATACDGDEDGDLDVADFQGLQVLLSN